VNGIDYTLVTDKPGDFAVLIRSGDISTVNRIEYSVTGAANLSPRARPQCRTAG